MAETKIVRMPELRFTRSEIRSMRGDVARIFRYGDELELTRFLRGIGIKDQDPRFGRILTRFRELRSGKP